MSAGYAHITLVNQLGTPNILDKIGFPHEAAAAVLDWFKFCELGAISPDYPYLKIEDAGAQKWADDMHKRKAGEMIHTGISLLKEKKGEARGKGLAWLLGYAAHVYTDLTIHPVVNLKVGRPYELHKTEHRICEMHQDVYIYQRLNLGPIEFAEHLDSGIVLCAAKDDKEVLDIDITEIWSAMLQKVYEDDFSIRRPKINEWHKRFKFVIDKIAEEGGKLVPLARHVASGLGLVYPSREEVDINFIKNLKTPSGFKHYDEIFDHAKEVVLEVWQLIAEAIIEKTDLYFAKIGKNVNLDEGTGDKGEIVTWEVIA